MAQTCLGNAIYRTNDHTAYIGQLCNSYNALEKKMERFRLDTWIVISESTGQLEQLNLYTPIVPNGTASCHGTVGSHVVYPEQWCSDPYHQTYYRGPITLASFKLEQWEYPGSAGTPIFWVDKSICRPVQSMKGHPGSTDPYIADGFTITQTFANLTTTETPPSLPPVLPPCGPGEITRVMDQETEASMNQLALDVTSMVLPALGLRTKSKTTMV